MQHSLELPAVALKNAFAGLSKIISSKSTLPVLACVRVEADANGVTCFQATDLDSFVTCQVQGSPGGFPACLVPFDTLNRIAKGAKNPVRLVREDGKISVQSSFGTATVAQSLTTHALEEWPPLPTVSEPTFTGNAAFKQALREALECASVDSSRYVLNGACLDLSDPACHSVVGTDGRHLFSANTFQFTLPQSVIVPTRKFLGWSGFAQDGEWRVGVALKKDEPEWLELRSDHWSFITKPIQGNYPNWRQVIPREGQNTTAIALSEEAVSLMLDALPRLPGSDDNYQPVDLIVANGQFSLSARAKGDPQASRVPVPGAAVTGDDAQIRLNRSFVTKALRFGFTSFEITDELSPILFTAPGRKLIAMPIRLESSSSPKSTPQPEAEAAARATPSAEAPEETPTETRNTMPTETNLTPPRRGNLQPKTEDNNENHNGTNGQNGSALAAAITQVETVKTGLRDVIIELNATLDLLRAAEREKKASFKEVESVRATLRSLQKVAI
jgi:DNA polymerase III sliding clamp (beta) subunit (PCNA family)